MPNANSTASWEGDESDQRRIDPQTGEVLESVVMPPVGSGIFRGGGKVAKVRVVRRPRRA